MRQAFVAASSLLLFALAAGCGNGAPNDASTSAPASIGATSASTSAAPATTASPSGQPRTAASASASGSSTAPSTSASPDDDPVLDFGSRIKIPGLTDPKTCRLDGPFWPGSVSYYGGSCSVDDPGGCFGAAAAFYQEGRWACAREYHIKACELSPHLTDPPPGETDYALIGYPRCPFDKENRAAWKAKQLQDPTTKSCFIDHVAKACTELADKAKDPMDKEKLQSLAATLTPH